MEKTDINSLYIEELTEAVTGMGLPKYRGGQIYGRLHQKLATSFSEMTELPESLRQQLSDIYEIKTAEKVSEQVSKFDGTRKYLFAMGDGSLVESVLMKYHHGNSVCISSQVGCRMGCRFCASTLDGLTRNLTASEMLGQIYSIVKLTGERVSNIVVMGTGEPMDNYDNLIRFIKLISHEKGLNISKRNITVSTCGIVPKMRAFADEGLPVTLALSLHSVTDEKRRQLMPVANSYSIEELMSACEYYFEKTGRRITFEYSLVRDVNDTDPDAEGLIRLAGRVGAHINLIPVNPIKEREYRETAAPRVLAFKNKLEKSGINVTIRREMGRDIDGACGQLRKRTMDERGSRRGQGA
ncbi:MAG: 23S rRNA (adenine(2503)-C(2))-methyltransferase RlmN [Lachnospiraceae bacterium]|nr:23S rRNA (adenine(2503)-C(2))-methyltransferase RlmN [Lachnospiraceae bacterium]